MANSKLPLTHANPAEQALRTLELFSDSASISFDRTLAARTIGEAERAIPGGDWQTWASRLIEVGESLNLRIRSIEATVDEAMTMAREGIPLATCVDEEAAEQWLLVAETSGRRVRLISDGDTSAAGWASIRELKKTLATRGTQNPRRWVIGQPALACDPPVATDGQRTAGHALPPLGRLLGLLRPEKKDIWTVLVFSLVVGLLALASPIAVEALVNTVAFGRYLQPVIVLAILLFTFLAFAASMRALITYLVEILQRRLFVRVVEDLAYRLPRVEQRSLDHRHAPELVNRFFDVVTVQKSCTTLLLDGLAVILQTVIGMAVIAFYHPFLLGFDIALLVSIAFVIFVLGRGAVGTAVKESKAKYAIGNWLQELARHPTAFKLHAGAQYGLDRADQLAVNWLEARRIHFRVIMRQILFALGLQAVAATALLGLGGWLVILGELTLGQLVAAELIIMIIVGSFAKLGKHMESFYDLLAAVDKLGLLFDLPTEPHDKLFHLQDGTPASIDLQNVTYKYGSHVVLKELSFELSPGDSAVLRGAAGSGKSTLIDLLCGIRQPDTGHIELDGIDLRELRPDALREHVAVARSVEIFGGSIDENVHLNRPHISALDVREALAAVGLLDELLTLPDGLNTKLQTNGAPLSSSQASRLMLARAIVRRPRLLLVDGTLDGLPDEIIASVVEKLTDDKVPWTLLVASNRQAVKQHCRRSIGLPRHEKVRPAGPEKIDEGERASLKKV